MSFSFFGRTFHFLADASQQEKAIHMVKAYILKPEIIILILIIVAYLAFRLFATIANKRDLSIGLKKLSPWVYLFIILGFTVFNRSGGIQEIRLVPDSWIAGEGRVHESAILGFIFNVALYVPFGYFLYKYLNIKKKWIVSASIILVSSLIIELLQFVFARGVTAIDDFIANTIGGLIGIILAFIWRKIICKKQKME